MTPKEDLMLETLCARVRLGHRQWTFEARHRDAARGLEGMGYVGWKMGTVEKTIIVWPTRKLLDSEHFSPHYKAPALEESHSAIRDIVRAWRHSSHDTARAIRDAARVLPEKVEVWP